MTAPSNLPWTPQRIRDLGVVTDLLTAAKILKIGRTKAYQMARTGTFPVPVTSGSRKYSVAVLDLLRHVHIEPNPLDPSPTPRVDASQPSPSTGEETHR